MAQLRRVLVVTGPVGLRMHAEAHVTRQYPELARRVQRAREEYEQALAAEMVALQRRMDHEV